MHLIFFLLRIHDRILSQLAQEDFSVKYRIGYSCYFVPRTLPGLRGDLGTTLFTQCSARSRKELGKFICRYNGVNGDHEAN